MRIALTSSILNVFLMNQARSREARGVSRFAAVGSSVTAVVVAALLAACSSDAPSAGSVREEPAATGGSVVFDCKGTIRASSIGVRPLTQPRDPCDEQLVEFSYRGPVTDCDNGVKVYAWNGLSCEAHPVVTEAGSLVCKGDDCSSLYANQADCVADHKDCLHISADRPK